VAPGLAAAAQGPLRAVRQQRLLGTSFGGQPTMSSTWSTRWSRA